MIASLRLRTRLHLLLTPSIWSDDALTHAIVAGAALLFAYLAKAVSNLDPLTVDFSIFYLTARAWLEGQPMYGQIASSVQLVNYNPPHFHLLVLPFAILPRSVSFVSWTVVSAALACATVRIAVRESAQHWPHRNVRLLVASTFLAAGVGATVRLGQLSWWLALSVTIAWRAARQKRSVVAGFWLGLAIGVKPFLLLLLPIVAIRREMVTAIVATVTALASLAAGAVFFGWPAVRDWAHLLETPPPFEQLRYFINASIAGLISRAELPLVLSAVLAVVVVLGTVLVARHSDVDRAWLLRDHRRAVGFSRWLDLLLSVARRTAHRPGCAETPAWLDVVPVASVGFSAFRARCFSVLQASWRDTRFNLRLGADRPVGCRVDGSELSLWKAGRKRGCGCRKDRQIGPDCDERRSSIDVHSVAARHERATGWRQFRTQPDVFRAQSHQTSNSRFIAALDVPMPGDHSVRVDRFAPAIDRDPECRTELPDRVLAPIEGRPETPVLASKLRSGCAVGRPVVRYWKAGQRPVDRIRCSR